MKLDAQRIDEVLVGTKYGQETEKTYEQVVGRSVYIQTVSVGNQEIHADARENAAKALLLERLCGDLLVTLKEVLNSDMAQREEDEGNVSEILEDVRHSVAQARELGIGE